MDSRDLGAIRINLERLSQRNRDIAVSFVYTQLLTGLASCRLLRSGLTHALTRRAWHLEYATKALQDAEAAMWKLKLSHPEFDQMMAIAERLRFELDALEKE
jgi:hypothetical protein